MANETPDPTAGHTPIPWKVSPNDNGLIVGGSNGISSIAVAHVMPELRPQDAAWPVLKANAALIVRAVNHHAALVEALRAVVNMAALRGPCPHRTAKESVVYCDHTGAMKAARAVLAAVEQE